jgi:pyrroline-5-carboxylate reductase
MKSIGIIGMGTLGGALARGLRRASPQLEVFATRHGDDNCELAARTRRIVLCVKPQQARGVLREIAPSLTAEHRIISTCTAVTLDRLRGELPEGVRVARAMPNIACEFNEGVTAVSFGEGWDEEMRLDVLDLFGALGEAMVLEERHFDAVTALSGCGPAYVCVIIEALSDAGVKAGLAREVARRMAVQTVLGSSVLIRELNEHPAAIRDRVTTPGGCTIDALTQLEEGRLRATLIAAVSTAAEKSARIGAGISAQALLA